MQPALLEFRTFEPPTKNASACMRGLHGFAKPAMHARRAIRRNRTAGLLPQLFDHIRERHDVSTRRNGTGLKSKPELMSWDFLHIIGTAMRRSMRMPGGATLAM
jgi:hypothetical protein